MASLELRGNRYRIVFRLGGTKSHVGVKTSDRKEAEACLARLEENLRLVERGRLTIPDGADVGLLLISDGKLERRIKVLTVGELVTKYLATYTVGTKEKSTTSTERIHLRHADKVLGNTTLLSAVTSATLQGYIDSRASTK